MNKKTGSAMALEEISINARGAFDALSDPEYAKVPDNEKQLWAMCTIIHCDIVRFIDASYSSSNTGIVGILWAGDLVSKLVEAEQWYRRKGSKILLEIAKKNGIEELVKVKIKELQNENPIKDIKIFKNYRNKVGFHYDLDALDHLKEFGESDIDEINKILTIFVRYSFGWSDLTKMVIENRLSEKA